MDAVGRGFDRRLPAHAAEAPPAEASAEAHARPVRDEVHASRRRGESEIGGRTQPACSANASQHGDRVVGKAVALLLQTKKRRSGSVGVTF
jgi:hypothetical protein